MHTTHFNRQELVTYAILWGLIFLTPVLSIYTSSTQDSNTAFHWTDVFFVWNKFVLFLAAFLIHNFLLAPLFVERQRYWLYGSLVALLLAAFTLMQCAHRPDRENMLPQEQAEGHRPHQDHDRGLPDDFRDDFRDDFMPPDERHMDREGHEPPPHRPEMGPHHTDNHPPMMVGQRDVVAIIVLILMLGMNLGVKLFFKQQRDHRKMALMEKKSLEQQLEYLRYQINPHFLMNTLNNIHALVDIDTERAKESIVELSKIMRFVLYEGAKQKVPLSRELAFTQDYIKIMRMRVSNQVRISVDMPQEVPNSQIPPLVLITFVENAFKHGISYRQESFIDISVKADDHQLHFSCTNSIAPKNEEQAGGVGLKNVRKRLDLIYGKKYTLENNIHDNIYNIKLMLPLE